jgi:transposase-like protein
MSAQTTERKERGEAIAKLPNQIQRFDDCHYVVKSQSHDLGYNVNRETGAWTCNCLDHFYRKVKCKHIYAVEFSRELRLKVESKKIMPLGNLSTCIHCGSSNIIKKGIRKNKTGNLQRFYCQDCHKIFTFNIGFERMKHNPQAITSAMQLYFSGESLRNTAESLQLLGVEVSYRTILNWIKKYVKLMKEYTEKITPEVSDTWRADELWIKVSGNMKYLFSMMDDETRFWIAQEVAETKDKHDARNLLRMSKEVCGKKPKIFITDGLKSYHQAFKQEFLSSENSTTKHINEIMLKGAIHNNKMERMNGEIRDREKTMRGLKTDKTAILQGYQLYHNFIRPHQALNGKTPSEACGITIEGENKWKTLIENASKQVNNPKT